MDKKYYKVKISNQARKSGSSEEKTIWGNYQFIDYKEKECDFWVIIDGLSEPEKAFCNPDNVILITQEPPSIKQYNKEFTQQFGTVVTCHRNIKAKNIIYTQQGLGWHVGWNRDSDELTLNYDDFKSFQINNKTKILSAISSSKTETKGHIKRLNFVMKLKQHFGDKIDVFGNGINYIADKWDGISDYKYHIAIENSSIKDYWTEKLSDCYLAGAYPFYCGCTNLSDYFPEGSFTYIDINNFDKSVAIIEEAIKNNLFENSMDKILQARDLVLDKYSQFPLIAGICDKLNPDLPKNEVLIHPQRVLPQNRIKKNLKRIFIVSVKDFIKNLTGSLL